MWWALSQTSRTIIQACIFVLLFSVFMLPKLIKYTRHKQALKAMPEQKVRAKVAEKALFRHEGGYRLPAMEYQFVTFETADGIKVKLELGKAFRLYSEIQEGDAGMLRFKGPVDSDRYADRLFISFEKE